MLHAFAVFISIIILMCVPIVFFLVTKEIFRELDPVAYLHCHQLYLSARDRFLHHYVGFRIWWLTCATLTIAPRLCSCRNTFGIYARRLKISSGKTLRALLYQC